MFVDPFELPLPDCTRDDGRPAYSVELVLQIKNQRAAPPSDAAPVAWRDLLMRVVAATGTPNPTNPREHRIAPGMGMAFSAAVEDAIAALNGADK